MAKRKSKSSNLTTALLFTLIGAICCIFGAGLINYLLIIGGILFIIFGIIEIVKKNIVSGIISTAIGIVLLAFGGKLVEVIMIILGVVIIIKGVIALINSLRRNRATLDIVFAVLTIVAGIILAFAFGQAADIVIRIAGAILAVTGIIEIAGSIVKKR